MIDYGYSDVHSHVLWGVDDGAEDMETSIELCKLAHETGTDFLFLTPHIINWSDASLLYDLREEKTEYLQNVLYDEGVELNWEQAADNIGISHYRVMKNGEFLYRAETFDGYHRVSFTDANGSIGDRYTIVAFDAAGNISQEVEAK